MEAKFSNRVKEVISLSREEALRLGHDYIGTEHLLLGVIREGEGLAISLLKKLGISLDDLRASVEHNTKNTSVGNLKNMKNIPLTRQSEKVLKITYLEAKIFKSKIIGTEHLLLSILRDEDNIATQILDKFDVSYDVVKELLEYQSSNPVSSTSSESLEEDDLSKIKLVPKVISSLKKLNNYGYQFVMVSNQDGLGTDSFPQESFDKCQSFILDLFSTQGIDFRKILICPHFDEDQCDCRKPKTGLLTEFLTHENIDTARSYVIGDRDTDMLLAERMAIQGIMIDPYEDDVWDKIANQILNVDRQAEVLRKSNETEILTRVNLSASSPININTGIGFFDHMLEQLAKHSGISIEIDCKGDLHIDEHHTVEDVSITLGDALYKALSNKVGIGRYGFTLPMDDALAQVAIDLSGRPYFKFEGEFNREKIGDLPTELITHFFHTLSQNMKANIHISIKGEDDHHKAEACFKALGRALLQAIKQTDSGDLPTTKGLL